MPPQLIRNPKGYASAEGEPLPPLLKWPGGKRWLVSRLAELFPAKINKYYEPFLGGAAVFFGFRPKDSILSDTNQELVNCYTQVRDCPADVLSALRKFPNNEKSYYRVRDLNPTDPAQRAARLIFLATLSFNGIFRQNLNGIFNVPYGKKTHLEPAESQRIMAASAALQGTKIIWGDFEQTTKNANAGDLIYFDPPYTVAHGNNGFVKYNAKIFSWGDQIRLANTAKLLAERGCFVFVSNADHKSIRELYDGFSLEVVERHSKIAASGAFRKMITECLFFKG